MKLPWTAKSPPALTPQVVPYRLGRKYTFMYNVGVISDQQYTYLFLESEDDAVSALVFDGATFKFGAPNDEVLGSHPLAQFGLTFYDFFEVTNSPWIRELCEANRVHPRHSDRLFSDKKHFVATFKDVTFEVVCRKFEERRLSAVDVHFIVASAIPGLLKATE